MKNILLRQLASERFALIPSWDVHEVAMAMDEKGWRYKITLRYDGFATIEVLAV